MDVTSVLDRAKQIAVLQGTLANSPADYDQIGRLTLCAGSCIAKAIIEASNDTELLRDFERLLLSEDKLAFIPYVFQKHGFDAEAARRVIQENDLRAEPERSSWFGSLASL
jgi:hypothetical protein